MNTIQELMSKKHNKLIECENCIDESKSSTSRSENKTIEQLDNKIAEIRHLALTLPKSYSYFRSIKDKGIRKSTR